MFRLCTGTAIFKFLIINGKNKIKSNKIHKSAYLQQPKKSIW